MANKFAGRRASCSFGDRKYTVEYWEAKHKKAAAAAKYRE